MKVFVFDLLPYGENLEHLRAGKELPYPLSKRYFKPDVAVRTYAEHLDAWQLLDELGYDGVGFNEHHTSPYGLMNSPNLMAASAAQRTKKIKLLIYGNLLPLHEPLRLAEELAMLDCLSNGRLISGFARGIPREYNVHNVKHSESRARFEEAYDIIMKAWTEDVFSYEGKFWSYHDVAIWPRPVQQPAPPVWTPITSSKESIEWAAAHNIPITPGLGSRGAREDIIRYYAQCLARAGHQITPGHLTISLEAYVADSKAQAVREYGPHYLYFNHVLFSHGNTTELELNKQTGYLTGDSTGYMRPENLAVAARSRADYRDMTMADVEKAAETLPWGTAAEVRDRIIEAAEHAGAGTVQLSFNRGAMPHEMFVEQIRRFARDVLPALQAHAITTVPLAAEAAASSAGGS
jgi:alkanesulfonate monooxygenase SsuD/methylene tetrahydromethanopterin reductase-like flavin-dependent oxidoreductase (luciferase family)